jgi:hypothetical protein
MIRSIRRQTLLETLINTLEAERYLRKPILVEVLDELDAAGDLVPAANHARKMLAGLQSGASSPAEFDGMLTELRSLVRGQTTSSAA